MKITKLIKINSLLFVFYFVFYIIANFSDFSFFFYPKALLGIAVFFMAGFNCAILVKKISNLKLNFLETSMIGAIVSFFLIPLIVFLAYQISGTVREWLILLVYAMVASLPLVALVYKEKKNAEGKI